MLLRKPTKTVTKKIKIQLPADVAERLDRLTEKAKEAGLEASLEDAIAEYITRAVGHAESQLKKSG